MEGGKAAIAGVDLPEEDILASNLPASRKLTQVMANCTLDFSGVTDRPTIEKLMDKMVITDRWFYLVQLRVLSLGPQYQFEAICPACGVADKLFYSLGQIQVKNAPKAKELFTETDLPSGRKVRWKVADGLTDEKITKLATERNAATVGLFARTTEVDGKPASISDVLNMSLKDRTFLRQQIDAKEGEFDDEFDARCNKCSHEYRAQLQLDARSFFSL
jgi:hypothetical protein